MKVKISALQMSSTNLKGGATHAVKIFSRKSSLVGGGQAPAGQAFFSFLKKKQDKVMKTSDTTFRALSLVLSLTSVASAQQAPLQPVQPAPYDLVVAWGNGSTTPPKWNNNDLIDHAKLANAASGPGHACGMYAGSQGPFTATKMGTDTVLATVGTTINVDLRCPGPSTGGNGTPLEASFGSQYGRRMTVTVLAGTNPLTLSASGNGWSDTQVVRIIGVEGPVTQGQLGGVKQDVDRAQGTADEAKKKAEEGKTSSVEIAGGASFVSLDQDKNRIGYYSHMGWTPRFGESINMLVGGFFQYTQGVQYQQDAPNLRESGRQQDVKTMFTGPIVGVGFTPASWITLAANGKIGLYNRASPSAIVAQTRTGENIVLPASNVTTIGVGLSLTLLFNPVKQLGIGPFLAVQTTAKDLPPTDRGPLEDKARDAGVDFGLLVVVRPLQRSNPRPGAVFGLLAS